MNITSTTCYTQSIPKQSHTSTCQRRKHTDVRCVLVARQSQKHNQYNLLYKNVYKYKHLQLLDIIVQVRDANMPTCCAYLLPGIPRRSNIRNPMTTKQKTSTYTSTCDALPGNRAPLTPLLLAPVPPATVRVQLGMSPGDPAPPSAASCFCCANCANCASRLPLPSAVLLLATRMPVQLSVA